MKIQVLGSGCSSCKKLFEITERAVSELKLDAKVDYLTGQDGIAKIVELGAMSSPVLTVDDKIVMLGFTSNIGKIKKLLQSEGN